MSLFQLASYLGWAGVYALVLSGAVLLAARLSGRPFGRWGAALLLLTLFFLALTMHPFPDRATVCQGYVPPPQLRPFAFAEGFLYIAETATGPLDWVRSRLVSSSIMNLVLCGAIGLAFAHVRQGWMPALAFALLLTFGVELTQLTGIWGFYACPYRQFDVDDLILNTLGVMSGVALARWQTSRGQASRRDTGHG